MTDTYSDAADKHLLVDWKGDGGGDGAPFVQQKLAFKQVKRRDASKTSTTLYSKFADAQASTLPIRSTPAEVVAKPLADAKLLPVTLVSLSDSDVSAPPASATKKPRLQLPGVGNVVCLDSDTDSETSVARWRLKTCSASQLPKFLERVAEKDDGNQQSRGGDPLFDHNYSIATPERTSAIDRECTLDSFGSGRVNSPTGDGPTISSSSKRQLSSRISQEDAGTFGNGFQSESMSDDELCLFPLAVEPSSPRLCVPERIYLNSDISGTRNVISQLREVQNEPGAQAGGTRKKRTTTGGKPMTEEEKAFDRNEKLRAKEVERLWKAEEKAEKKRQKEEEKKKLQEVNRRKREEEKLRREAAKEESKERRRLEHEKHRWETGKFALQNTRALIDTKVIEKGLIGGHLLNKLAEKQLQFQVVCNHFPRSIMWRMKRPSADCSGETESKFWDAAGADSQPEGAGSKLVLEEVNVPYILFVLEAEEFSVMVGENTLPTHISTTQAQYPGFTICYLVNKLKWYLSRRDQTQYKSGDTGWKRPPVEQALARLLTHYNGVHSRLCLDEAEVAEHITGLMRSLADSPFRPRSTSLSVSKNGDHVTKSDTFKEEIKKSLWLKALVALPRVPGSCALAIGKEYCNMRALLNDYLDQTKTVHQKELLLQDLIREGVLGPVQSRRVGPACSRRIYRILMSQNGNLKTDDVEQGADHFHDSD